MALMRDAPKDSMARCQRAVIRCRLVAGQQLHCTYFLLLLWQVLCP